MSRNKRPRGRRYTLSGRAQTVLSTVLEDIIEKTLEDARKMAESAGKERVSIEEVEKALRKLCQHLHPDATFFSDDIGSTGLGSGSLIGPGSKKPICRK
ncbi:uncharacterized protein LOC111673885 [Orussus abietinus]|uniref:uncharacterized protein LOC111673885 n=1 Tax=Orussus abietinus TaxID=222816 RepID=UPI000C715BD5|nr:uncharacterized protein LOC111673885 [Orussus abietinus]